MRPILNLADIQGNVVRAYGKFGFPVARHFFLTVTGRRPAGRAFVERLRPKITTAERWPSEDGKTKKPEVTHNIGFTFYGLWALGVPTRTLQGFPPEFIDGMKNRAFILGDRDTTLTEAEAKKARWDSKWDPIWRDRCDDVHIWVGINSQVEPFTDTPVEALDDACKALRDLCEEVGGVSILSGHGKAGADHQELRAVFATLPDGRKIPTPREHFGFSDGIGDPVFRGQLSAEAERERLPGRGKILDAKKGWEPLATGEFLLGHADEGQELPPAPKPVEFSRNGTFVAWRKLHENVGSYRAYFDAQGEKFAAALNLDAEKAKVTLEAKVVGRWPDGVPLAAAGTHAEWIAKRKEFGLDADDPLAAAEAQRDYLKHPAASDFRYADDMPGYNAPKTCHMRRVNTRDYLDPLNDVTAHGPDANPNATTQLNRRRRIMRRGLPYGEPGGDDDTEQGVIFMALCASLFRQFEFLQQQWIQYGLDFNAGNQTCPLLGDHKHHNRFPIPARPGGAEKPVTLSGLPTFVEPRGGCYLFMPSMTGLRMIGMGVVDPT
jgi:deferrochelatase/peroxidase EfeB